MKKLIVVCLVLFSTVCSVNAEGGCSKNKVLGTADGRYVFGQISQMGRDQYMLDVKTGRLWFVVIDNKKHTLSLVPVFYQKPEGGFSYVPGK